MDERLSAAARLTGTPARTAHPLSDTVTEVTLSDGRTVIVKHADAPGAALAEAAGLRWLTAAGADGVGVPEVYGHDAHWLVTERVPPGTPTREAALTLGRGLATLHAAGAPAYGAPPPEGPEEAYIGRAPMSNAPGPDDWPTWYAGHRVLPYLRRAVDLGTMSPAEARLVEGACARLPALAGPAEPPARVHGDLWNGNVVWSADGHPWLIDPAAHGGHRETDLAMLHLFGCPHLDLVVTGYEETAPLPEGWRDRIGAHQLFPLLVHVVLFGRGYVPQTLEAAGTAN